MIDEASTLFKEILDTVYENNKHADLELIEEVYRFAEDLHKGQFRKSGEPYILHPMNVALILTSVYADYETISAGLLFTCGVLFVLNIIKTLPANVITANITAPALTNFFLFSSTYLTDLPCKTCINILTLSFIFIILPPE